MNFEKYSTVIWKRLSELILKQTADVYDIVKYSLGVLDQEGNIQTKPSGKILRRHLVERERETNESNRKQ